jgi:nucleotide-binding universal stress UspA family protein
MMQKILCPTDLSENSLDSVAYALQLAKENGAQLIVFHATSFPSFIYYPCELEPFYQWQELVSKSKVERILADAENKVKNFVCARFGAESDGVVWQPRVALGRASEEIVTAAFQEGVDLIVMARCKRATLARIFTSSISEAVRRGAPCPVLSIDATQFARPSHGWRVPLLREIFQRS